MKRAAAIAFAALVVAVIAPGTAHADGRQLSVMEDDHLLLYSGAVTRAAALDEMQRLGVTTIHALVVWSRLVPSRDSYTRPSTFDATDPSQYVNWGAYDDLVQSAQARGMQVLFTPTGPAPQWASQCARNVKRRGRCKPIPSEFGDFVRALATRYSGAYWDGGQILPRVSAWSFWNEPNHKGWLIPQTVVKNGVTLYVGAQRYRELAQAGLAALTATGHDGDLKLIGDTAPLGGSNSTAPILFLREMLCLDGRFRPYSGAAANIRGCSRRPHFAIGGVADHPYTYAGIARPGYTGKPDDAPIGALSRINRLLDSGARYGILPAGLPIYLTEFGFQTRPPDPYGISLALQAQYLNYSDYVAYRNARIASVAQFELRDDPNPAVFNTGLRFANGRPKPALTAYALPIYVTRTSSTTVRVFGLARFAHGASASVAIQHRRRASDAFRTVAYAATNDTGYFVKRLRASGGQWRLVAGQRRSRVAAAE